MLFSIIIPFQYHRSRALDCVRGWVTTQTLDAAEFELICVLPADDPDRLRAPIAALLRPHDRLILSRAAHDMGQCAEGAALARGEFLLFTESHVWPEHDVLLAAKTEFDRHPEWAGLSGRTLSVAKSSVAWAEADHYDDEIEHAMLRHPWRKILDQCFVTRRQAYRDSGGLDASLGHFAEWALAARYFDLGLTIGYAPHITLRHYSCGDLDELAAFTRSFVDGEIEFFARGCDAGSAMWGEMPHEWGKRAALNRRLTGALATCLRRALLARPRPAPVPALLRWYVLWSALAAGGAGLVRRTVDLRVTMNRLLLTAAIAPSRAWAQRRFEALVAGIIWSRRLSEIEARLQAPDPAAADREIVAAEDRCAGRMVGFHMAETVQSVPLRWSRPAALVELPAPAARVAIHCAPLRPPLAQAPPMFFVDETPVAREAVTFNGHGAVIALDRRASGRLRLAWICTPHAVPGDRRQLGLPVTRISVGTPEAMRETERAPTQAMVGSSP